ncbi:MAG: transporter substrate-binding domain-containing protein [Betaproteobacteria bacterium]|nr:transporter substrate-binding domain-containing protein [Betaproteobacteria bacterium]
MFKKLIQCIAVVALALGSAAAQADKLADILAKGVVRIIVFTDVPPFSSTNVNRELEGFDVDLAKMVAAALGVKLELVSATAANRIPYLLTDKADMNVAAMSVTAERAKQVMYSAPYADTSLAVYGPKSANVKTGADLGKQKISVAKGTTEDIVLTSSTRAPTSCGWKTTRPRSRPICPASRSSWPRTPWSWSNSRRRIRPRSSISSSRCGGRRRTSR